MYLHTNNPKHDPTKKLTRYVDDVTDRTRRQSEKLLYMVVRRALNDLYEHVQRLDGKPVDILQQKLHTLLHENEPTAVVGGFQRREVNAGTVNNLIRELERTGIELRLDITENDPLTVGVTVRAVTDTLEVTNYRDDAFHPFHSLPGNLNRFDTLTVEHYQRAIREHAEAALDGEITEMGLMLYRALLTSELLDQMDDDGAELKNAIFNGQPDTLSGQQYLDELARISHAHGLDVDIRMTDARLDDDERARYPHGGTLGMMFIWQNLYTGACVVTDTQREKAAQS